MSNNVSSVLNELIETSKDGEKGFRAAAEDTKNSELKGCSCDAPKSAPLARPICSNWSPSTAANRRWAAVSLGQYTAVG